MRPIRLMNPTSRTMATAMPEPTDFTCPRCGTDVSEQFYGPCTSCRTALRAKFLGEARDVEVAEYVPKMNVTPNAVALKDD